MNPLKTMIQAKLMITFLRIVESGGISAAAARLGLDKASVSRQLKELEDMLGVRLLNRSTRNLSLTDVGKVVFERAGRMMFEVENAKLESEAFSETPTGVLSISASVALGHLQIVPQLSAFMKKYPAIEIELCLLNRQVNIVEEAFDILLRVCDEPPNQLVAHKLSPINYILVASPAYLKLHQPIQDPLDLHLHNCLFHGYRDRMKKWVFRDKVQSHIVSVKSNISVNSTESLRRLALDDLGIALVPTFLVKNDVADGALIVVLPEFEVAGYLGTSLYALHLPEKSASPKIHAFLDFLKAEWVPTLNWGR